MSMASNKFCSSSDMVNITTHIDGDSCVIRRVASMPSSTGSLLPYGNTRYSFEKLESGFKLKTDGPGAPETMLLDSELRITSGVSEPPENLRFTTVYEPGPNGFLLESVQTEEKAGYSMGGAETFAYTYQTVDGFQLPSEVTVSPSTTKPFHFVLAGCSVVRFEIIHIEAKGDAAH